MTDKQVIDLSCIVGKDVLCEFWDDGAVGLDEIAIGFIIEYNPIGGRRPCTYACSHNQDKYFDNCRILENHWIANPEGDLVLPDGLEVELSISTIQSFDDWGEDTYIEDIKFRGFTKTVGKKKECRVYNDEMDYWPLDAAGVGSFKVIGPAPNWAYSKQ